MPTCLLAALLLSAAAPTATADESLRFSGRVLDSQRAPIPAALVAVSGRRAAETRTDAEGAFSVLLGRGRHTVTVTAPGFRPASEVVEVGGAEAAATRDFAFVFVLQIAPVGETVTVRGETGYTLDAIGSATRTLTPLLEVPQSITVTSRALIRDQMMLSVGDAMRYVPGIQVHQGENNRDQVIIRGNGSSADFFLNGVRDDAQYYRDLYNAERIEALKGPNAMVFGRGGGGGVVNRVSKEAVFAPVREVTAQAGDFGHLRAAADVGGALGRTVAFRLNAVYEDSDSFRRDVSRERYGVNPTLTFAPSARTRLTLGYENLHDARVADRGITSYAGLPADVDRSTYYGNPADSRVRGDVDLLTATAEHSAGRLVLRNRTVLGAYDRFYQNYVPGAVSADKSLVAVTAYNNATQRDNVFSQTDLVWSAATGAVHHTLLAGFELGRQRTENFRQTGYFDGGGTSLSLPYSAPTTGVAASFRQSATDADNHLEATVGAAFAQDQVELSRWLQVVAGVRFDRFDLTYNNDRNGDVIDRVDDLVSPRLGVVLKPLLDLAVYGSYTVSHLPASGDQFSSLTTVTEQLKPEAFDNYEVGVKWDAHPGLSLTSALYRLDRTNTRSSDPNDPSRIVQTGSQRSNGVELGITGRLTRTWQVAGGYAYQDARVTSATATARAGARVAQVPRHTLSLWNQVQVLPRLGLAVGILHRSEMYAGIDNTVILPGFSRLDLAAFCSLTRTLRLQANLENALDRTYWLNADSNTNISPGSGRALRLGLTAAF